MSIIYLLRNTSKIVIWVGQTINPKRRLREHRKVFGPEVSMETVQIVDATDVAVAEQFWITYHRADGAPLSNRAKGGKGRAAVSDETRQRLSAAGRGKKKPKGFGAKISAATKGRAHEWTDEGKRNAAATQIKPGVALLLRASSEGIERHRENSKKVARGLSSEERSRRNKKAWAPTSPEQRAARTRACVAGQLAARSRIG